MLAQPGSGEETAGIAQGRHEHQHDGMRHRMIVERQRHDQTGGEQWDIQYGEHGDRHMAQTAMADFALLMVE